MLDLISLLKRLLPFQLQHQGYDNYVCASCGGRIVVDHKASPTIQLIECLNNCPWRQLRNYVEDNDD